MSGRGERDEQWNSWTLAERQGQQMNTAGSQVQPDGGEHWQISLRVRCRSACMQQIRVARISRVTKKVCRVAPHTHTRMRHVSIMRILRRCNNSCCSCLRRSWHNNKYSCKNSHLRDVAMVTDGTTYLQSVGPLRKPRMLRVSPCRIYGKACGDNDGGSTLQKLNDTPEANLHTATCHLLGQADASMWRVHTIRKRLITGASL